MKKRIYKYLTECLREIIGILNIQKGDGEMLKEKALRIIKAEFKEYKQRILTNLSKEYIFEIAYQIYVKSRIYDF